MPVYQMVANGTDRVLVLSDANVRRARGSSPRVSGTAMSFRTAALRVSIVLGIATVVATILWFTPPPCEYWAWVDLGLILCMQSVMVVVLEILKTEVDLRTKYETRTNDSVALSKNKKCYTFRLNELAIFRPNDNNIIGEI